MEFTKLHGTGNDFVVIDARSVDRDWSALARAICDRHFGVGGDGMILAAAPAAERADARMRIFNADGSEAEMSGNGMRCLVKFVVDAGIVSPRGDEFDVETGAGVLRVRITTDAGRVTSVRESMGPPRLDPREIPVAIDAPPPITNFEIQAAGRTVAFTPVSMGNPHAVYFQDQPGRRRIRCTKSGRRSSTTSCSRTGSNFEVVRMLDRDARRDAGVGARRR